MTSLCDTSEMQVNVSVSLEHDRIITFPSVTFCNLNPIKSSLVSTEPELYNLLHGNRRKRSTSDSGDDGNRRKRSTSNSGDDGSRRKRLASSSSDDEPWTTSIRLRLRQVELITYNKPNPYTIYPCGEYNETCCALRYNGIVIWTCRVASQRQIKHIEHIRNPGESDRGSGEHAISQSDSAGLHTQRVHHWLSLCRQWLPRQVCCQPLTPYELIL